MGGKVIPFETPKSSATQGRILDAAEALFMEHGFEATSLRQITTAANVNLAAVHYHFGSKEDLFEAVLTRRLDPMNQERLALLTRFEHEWAPKPLSCEKILAAMFIPALKLARDPERGGKNFLRLLGRAYADPAPFIRHFLSDQYAVVIARFKAAFGRALPLLVVIVLAGLLVVLAISLNFPPLRRPLISDGVLAVFRRILPPMTPTEREAIEAGTVGWDGDLFSGRPDWGKLLALPAPKLTAEEQRFFDHECEELCAMVTDWETTHIYLDLPQPVWQYIKDKGFLGMIIPKEYGGLGLSVFAHSPG